MCYSSPYNIKGYNMKKIFNIEGPENFWSFDTLFKVTILVILIVQIVWG